MEAYLTRWRVEETIRFVKQSYGFENIRVMTYTRIRNMASLVLASAYFATVWIGRNIRREVLAEHLEHLGKRLGEVPEFAAYAIADGIRRAFTRSLSIRVRRISALKKWVNSRVFQGRFQWE